jgi:hypothetical protein
MPRLSRRLFVAAAIAAAALPPLAHASERPILTVTGKIRDGGTVRFDRAALEAVGLVSFRTASPWYAEPVVFEGVPLSKLMAAVGAGGERILVIALNDYSAEVPMEDLARFDPILALKRDGAYMPVRDKGPLFLVYPFDSNPELRHQKYYSRSVWQVSRLEIR